MKKYKSVLLAGCLSGLLFWVSGCQTSSKHLEEGRRLMRENKWKEAVAELNKAVEANPSNTEALNARGVAYFQLKDYQNAALDYDQAIAADSAVYLPFFNRAKLKLAQNDFEAAIRDFSKATQLAPDSAEVFLNRGFVYAQLHLPQQASADFDKAIQLDNDNPESYYVRGNLKLEQKDFGAAILDYEKAVGLHAKFPEAFFNMGLAQNMSGNREAACLHFKQAQKLGYADAKDAIEAFCK